MTQALACRRRYVPQQGWRLFAKQHARAGSLVMEYVGML